MDNIIEKRKSFIINFIYIGIFVGLYYFVIKYAFGYVFPFIVAAGFAVLLQKPVRAISNKLHIRAHGAVSIFLVLFIVLVLIGGLAGIGFAIVNELRDFFSYVFAQVSSINELIEIAKDFVMGLVVKLPASISETAGDYVNDFFNNIGTKELELNMSAFSAPLSGAWSVVKGIPSAFLTILVTVISCVFMTADYDNIKEMLLGMCSKSRGEKLVNSKRSISKGVSKLFKAYATIMLITFTEMFVGLYFLKLIGVYKGGYIAIIAFVTCIVDIIPVLGTGTIIIPWAIYNLVTGRIGLGIALIILYAVITVLRQVIEPKLVANQVGLPAIVTIMAMFIGARAFGTFGIIILPLTVIIVKLMYDEGVIGRKKELEKEHIEASLKASETGGADE